jgi:hypothetical protein
VRPPRPWLPWLLGAGLILFLALPALDPNEQIFYRDASRAFYPFKRFIFDELHAGRLPFWFPWTESGTPLLGQITPALFHPLTALYLIFPFELAFKLNHLLVLPLAFAGAYLLARRMGAEAWGACVAGIGYAGSGFVVSMAGSNVDYGVGSAMLPFALHGLLRFVAEPRPLRLLWASAALALCFVGGDPQSMLMGGLIGAVWVVGAAVLRGDGLIKALGQVALWGFCALLLAAPALAPALARLPNSVRAGMPSKVEQDWYANAPARLLGLVVPWAFDDTQEDATAKNPPYYTEYLARHPEEAFADSLTIGAPLLLLALASRRRGLPALIGAGILLLASTGNATPVLRTLNFLVPGLRLFRYPEKLLAPATLLLALAASLGAQQQRRILRSPAVLASVLALSLLALRIWRAPFIEWLEAHGQRHAASHAEKFTAALGAGLAVELVLTLLFALASFAREKRAAAYAVLCAGAAAVQHAHLIHTVPLEILHAPLLLAEELRAYAGPSEGTWRLRADTESVLVFDKFDLRVSRMQAAAQALDPQLNMLGRVESVNEYTSMGDRDYHSALVGAPTAFNEVMGARFDVQPGWSMTPDKAASLGYRQAAFGQLVKVFPERPRAFFAGCARAFSPLDDALRAMRASTFRAGEAIVRRDLSLPCPAAPTGTAQLARVSPREIAVHTDAPSRQLLVVAEHFDPGWRATIDDAPADAVQVDLAAIGVVVPAGQHEVKLRFVPYLLPLGLTLAGLCAAALSLLELLQRKHRVRPAEPE